MSQRVPSCVRDGISYAGNGYLQSMKACRHGFSVHHVLEVEVSLPDGQVNLAIKHAIQVRIVCRWIVSHGVLGGNGIL